MLNCKEIRFLKLGFLVLEMKKLEYDLMRDVVFSIAAEKEKDKVREKYDKYLDYLEKKGLDYNKKAFEFVEKKYKNYLLNC